MPGLLTCLLAAAFSIALDLRTLALWAGILAALLIAKATVATIAPVTTTIAAVATILADTIAGLKPRYPPVDEEVPADLVIR